MGARVLARAKQNKADPFAAELRFACTGEDARAHMATRAESLSSSLVADGTIRGESSVFTARPMALTRTTLVVLFFATSAGSAFATHQYVVANNNVSPTNTVTVYELSGAGLGASLVEVSTVPTGGVGIGGGYPANSTIIVTNDDEPASNCVIVGDAGSGDISTMKPIGRSPYLQVVRNFHANDGDAATAGGLGLEVVGSYLYASYTGNGINIPPAVEVWSAGQCSLGTMALVSSQRGSTAAQSIAWQ